MNMPVIQNIIQILAKGNDNGLRSLGGLTMEATDLGWSLS